MTNSEELELVKKALTQGLDGAVEWDSDIAPAETELARHTLDLISVRKLVIEHVRNGGKVTQVKETRAEYRDRRDYWYKVIVPMPKLFKKGLFVEMELSNPDLEYPEIKLVGAHEQH